ncbi:Trp biosynthesis-associated membrane protein [Ornithinimicrobium murale]|uniref:Trp biosynthesis-associated membrane protein n=1 Tax=Ornithinimicrobium murale TaxID=1050153 RepID=UPI000E0DB246|nr:Trp biosynthesis-associated membrane protein [Ornithinimicrobium murale]
MRRWWLWAALGTALLLVASQQTWACGSWQDPVLGSTRVEASGTQVAGTLTAGALLAGAALLAGLVGSRPVRLAAAVCLAAGAVLAGIPTVLTLLGPGSAVEEVARQRPGATTVSVQIEAATTSLWPWVGLVAAALVLTSALLCLLHWLHPTGPRSAGVPGASSGVGPEGADETSQGASTARRRSRPRDPWDDLTQGHDPTVED